MDFETSALDFADLRLQGTGSSNWSYLTSFAPVGLLELLDLDDLRLDFDRSRFRSFTAPVDFVLLVSASGEGEPDFDLDLRRLETGFRVLSFLVGGDCFGGLGPVWSSEGLCFS